jgi:CrcB protein
MIVFIALGGVVGTLARYFVGAWLQGPHVAFPRGTLAINISGSFILGFVMRLAMGTTLISPSLRGALTVGFCGAFTTMSTFSYETVALATEGDLWRAGLYAGSTIAGCLCATVAGIALATKLL